MTLGGDPNSEIHSPLGLHGRALDLQQVNLLLSNPGYGPTSSLGSGSAHTADPSARMRAPL